MTGRTIRTLAGITMFALGQGGLAYAGPADTPLPTFSNGGPVVAVYHAFGVIKNNNLETDFVCTNTDSVARNVGIQVFDETGALRNTFGAGPVASPSNGEFLSVAPGQTVTFGTSGTNVLHEDQTALLNGAGTALNQLRNGSGRVVGASKNIACTAMLVDKHHVIQDPALGTQSPPTMVNLPLTKLP